MDRMWVVFKKEYLQKVKSLGFWLSTILLPVFMFGMMIVPMLLMTRARPIVTVAVVDPSGAVYPAILAAQEERAKAVERSNTRAAKGSLERTPEVQVIFQKSAGETPEVLKRKVEEKAIDGYLVIPEEFLRASEIEFYARNLSNITVIQAMESILNRAQFALKARALNLSPEDKDFLRARIGIKGFKVEKGKAKEEGALAGFFGVLAIFMTLYMLILIYGSFIMRAVLEEKSTRVVEILVSSVPPFQLLMGKILGVAASGLTQTAVWIGTAALLGAGVLPIAASTGSLPSFTLLQLVFFPIFFILGYLLFASLYAAVGAMFNNEQEAQQAATMVVIPIIIPVILMQMVIANPSSAASVVLSLLPFFTPLIMYLRILVETPPIWQIALSLVLTAATLVGVVYASGKIYRTGILMYGKRPNLKELWRWVRA
jgi:ABC-2 type transport system permease protein